MISIFPIMIKSLLLLPLLLITLLLSAQTDTAGFYTSFDGTKIFYEVKGSGQPVVLLHGFIVNSSTWKKAALYNDLQKAGYQVITLDLRGNGQSGKPHEAAAYANDAEAKDIMGLLTHLGIQQYQVVGYSRGSIITARLLVLDKRVQKAVLGGMGTDFTNPNWPRRIMFYRALSGDSIPELKGVVDYVQHSGLDQKALALLQKEQPSTPKEVLATVQQPVLVICGTEDSDNGAAADLARLFPHASFAPVPGNHNNAAASPQFSEAILAFLKR
ncbi:alpha/beta hydrolase [Paraflavitalea speifideaquila]|uniref:alpha/beta fold hydrolase n=1 Tax=Paraflavitalea speifideaquila TaxID=3076558 RepID=UPI0028E1AAAC|nr:alpha/beta hydrolase [Paraflavitalea speifideiaquila]